MTPPGSLPAPPLVQDELFDGPLDLLLDEVRRQGVAIEKISLAPVVARFLAYVHTAARRNLNLDMEWLHVAATLILWKSRSLLPPDATEPHQADSLRDDLIRQLLAHKEEATEELQRLRAVETARFPRGGNTGFEPRPPIEEDPVGPMFISVWDMMQQARDIARWAVQHREDQRYAREILDVEPDDVTVAGMADYLRTELAATAGSRSDGLRLLKDQPSLSHRSCLFLAMLEMVRDREVELVQNEAFGPITVALRAGL